MEPSQATVDAGQLYDAAHAVAASFLRQMATSSAVVMTEVILAICISKTTDPYKVLAGIEQTVKDQLDLIMELK